MCLRFGPPSVCSTSTATETLPTNTTPTSVSPGVFDHSTLSIERSRFVTKRVTANRPSGLLFIHETWTDHDAANRHQPPTGLYVSRDVDRHDGDADDHGCPCADVQRHRVTDSGNNRGGWIEHE